MKFAAPQISCLSCERGTQDWTPGVKDSLCKNTVERLPGNSSSRHCSKVPSNLKRCCPPTSTDTQIDGIDSLHVIDGTLNVKKYIAIILESKLLPSIREIGSRVGRNHATVMRICDRWMRKGTTDRRGQSHPPQ
ncbi:hypothetical protein TNCV_1017421 [Trichonephila clavipes]|uniref:Uncharacterized protein n=1 Tax=Trichonephila clavipes TaxID=2585209 RepID=A0A8X6VYG1_TRICX|nr:hypothetical protein TNCV_1017421 [Trichonephila clavipes]